MVQNSLMIAAHRGYSAKYPENTLLAFLRAVELGAHMLELDLRLSADGHIIIIHDETLTRTAQVEGFVSEYTLEQLKQFEVGSYFNVCFGGLKIPTFEEFCIFIRDYPQVLLNIEIKPALTAFEVADKAIAMLQYYGLMEQAYFTSFDVKILHYIIDKYKVRAQGFTTEQLKNADETIYKKLYSVAFRIDELTEDNISKYANKGLELWAYCADTDEQIELAKRYNITLVTCNELIHAL